MFVSQDLAYRIANCGRNVVPEGAELQSCRRKRVILESSVSMEQTLRGASGRAGPPSPHLSLARQCQRARSAPRQASATLQSSLVARKTLRNPKGQSTQRERGERGWWSLTFLLPLSLSTQPFLPLSHAAQHPMPLFAVLHCTTCTGPVSPCPAGGDINRCRPVTE